MALMKTALMPGRCAEFVLGQFLAYPFFAHDFAEAALRCGKLLRELWSQLSNFAD